MCWHAKFHITDRFAFEIHISSTLFLLKDDDDDDVHKKPHLLDLISSIEIDGLNAIRS